MSFRLLFVCTGNTCRSPIAERLARAALAPAELFGLEIGSEGTRAVAGRPMEKRAARVIRRAGADPEGFRTRRLTADLVAGADLILTATRGHRAAVVDLDPRAVRRTFTLRELAAIAAALPPGEVTGAQPADRAHALVAAAQRHRGLVPVGDLDIADPIGGRRKAYAQATAAIAEALDGPLGYLLGDPAGSLSALSEA